MAERGTTAEIRSEEQRMGNPQPSSRPTNKISVLMQNNDLAVDRRRFIDSMEVGLTEGYRHTHSNA